MQESSPYIVASSPIAIPQKHSGRARGRFIREMILIITSILIAFALDASWDAWRRTSDARHDRRALREEFRTNRSTVDRAIQRHANIQSRLQALLGTFASMKHRSDATVPDSLLSAVFEWRTQDWVTGTLQSFLASDGLQHIPDPEVRAAIAGWPARITDVNEDQELVRDYVNSVLIPSMAERIPIAHLVEPWPKNLTGTTVIRLDPKLHALIAARAAHQTLVVRSLMTFRAQIDSVVVRL